MELTEEEVKLILALRDPEKRLAILRILNAPDMSSEEE